MSNVTQEQPIISGTSVALMRSFLARILISLGNTLGILGKGRQLPGVMRHTCTSSTEEVEAGIQSHPGNKARPYLKFTPSFSSFLYLSFLLSLSKSPEESYPEGQKASGWGSSAWFRERLSSPGRRSLPCRCCGGNTRGPSFHLQCSGLRSDTRQLDLEFVFFMLPLQPRSGV